MLGLTLAFFGIGVGETDNPTVPRSGVDMLLNPARGPIEDEPGLDLVDAASLVAVGVIAWVVLR